MSKELRTLVEKLGITQDKAIKLSSGGTSIKPMDEIFADVARLVVAGNREPKVQRALKQFFATLKES